MGAWGARTFENDTALDWLRDLQETKPLKFLDDSLTPEDEGYLDFDDAVPILCASETIHALLLGPREGLPKGSLEWIEQNKNLNVSPLRPLCFEAIGRVLAENSELNELFAENEELYPEWKEDVQALRRALQEI